MVLFYLGGVGWEVVRSQRRGEGRDEVEGTGTPPPPLGLGRYRDGDATKQWKTGNLVCTILIALAFLSLECYFFFLRDNKFQTRVY